eukprot:4353272-Amphidinium_carterae.1
MGNQNACSGAESLMHEGLPTAAGAGCSREHTSLPRFRGGVLQGGAGEKGTSKTGGSSTGLDMGRLFQLAKPLGRLPQILRFFRLRLFLGSQTVSCKCFVNLNSRWESLSRCDSKSASRLGLQPKLGVKTRNPPACRRGTSFALR